MNKLYLIVGSLILNVLAASTLLAQDYDLVITGGRVIDPKPCMTISPMSVSRMAVLPRSPREHSVVAKPSRRKA